MAYTAVPTKSTGDPAYTATFINTYIKDNFAAGVPDIFTTKGDLAGGTGADTATRQAVGVNGTILQSNSGTASGFAMQIHPVKDKVTTKGDLLAATAADTLARIGTAPGYGHLVADSTQSAGVKWVSNAAALAYDGFSSSFLGVVLNNATEQPSFFQSERFDVATAMAVGTSSATTFTVPANGYYLVGCNVIRPYWEKSAGGGADFAAGELLRVSVRNAGTSAVLASIGSVYWMANVTYSTGITLPSVSGMDIIYLTAGTIIDLAVYQNTGDTLLLDTPEELQFFVIRLGAL